LSNSGIRGILAQTKSLAGWTSMQAASKSSLHYAFLQDAFSLEQHLKAFLHLEPETLASRLQIAQQDLAQQGRRDFQWDTAAHFYRYRVGSTYLFELAAWHLQSKDYIGDTLRLTADQAQGTVLDFGGGIGTHSLAAALCPQVTRVVFWDLNPVHREFVQFRAGQLGLSDKIAFPAELDAHSIFDTILCFDVMEHLPEPSAQLQQFREMLSANGRLIINWYFFKGFSQEFPFHLEDPEEIECFFCTLQRQFLEVFHPYLITARCYRQWPEPR
jgi:2-polyprenyl-3-methyl-5-hydroxy-6-metoxy-1,4-benzoquinol methylase